MEVKDGKYEPTGPDYLGFVTGVWIKLALAGNTWRARWKYRLFTDLTWRQALWNQAKGVVIGKFREESL